MDLKKINRALISVYHKDGIEDIANELISGGVEILSTGSGASFNIEQPYVTVYRWRRTA